MLITSWAHGWTERFQHLVMEVGLGKVGLVLMLEASRLARNNSDWYRLIEICGLTALSLLMRVWSTIRENPLIGCCSG